MTRQIVEVPHEEAAIIVELIDHYDAMSEELPKLYGHMADAFGVLGIELDSPAPRERTFTARRGLEELRKKYAQLAGDSPAGDSPVYPAAHQPTREELGGDRRVLRLIQQSGDDATLEWIAAGIGVTEHYAKLWLHDLQTDELVRELRDGRNRLTWEITPAGEAQL